jgi:hypothetical protein
LQHGRTHCRVNATEITYCYSRSAESFSAVTVAKKIETGLYQQTDSAAKYLIPQTLEKILRLFESSLEGMIEEEEEKKEKEAAEQSMISSNGQLDPQSQSPNMMPQNQEQQQQRSDSDG